MTKTKPPCYNQETKTDCPRRYIGCSAECEAWHEYLIAKAEEAEERRKRNAVNDDLRQLARGFDKRLRIQSQTKHENKKRRGIKEL